MLDGGPDAGSPMSDASSPRSDAGSPGSDASFPPSDAGLHPFESDLVIEASALTGELIGDVLAGHVVVAWNAASLSEEDRLSAVQAVYSTPVDARELNYRDDMSTFLVLPQQEEGLTVEAMAQTAAVLVVETLEGAAAGKLVYFMTVEEGRFRKPVFPGACLRIHVSKLRNRRNVWKFKGEAKVDGVLVAEAVFSAMIMED